ncbi:DinB family protein [Paenibacillus sp. BK033]|uniref:DinB family protein n=1 Tax=Paenibacillus sp. BK033 TaxID=2512133 RepID=UPI0010E5D971|nr:DinB family protein [Paenibacillus sp. BK033]TCM96351.1 DinB family protein [Paenibacillus sp. BK033]
MITQTVAQLERYVESVPLHLRAWSEERMTTPRALGKWSSLQILGHLCDSAINNMRRIIEAPSASGPYVITPYNQDNWVKAQQYASAPAGEIIALWESLNRSMVRVMSAVPVETLTSCQIRLANGETHTLEWLIRDYLEHLEHHLGQIFPQ